MSKKTNFLNFENFIKPFQSHFKILCWNCILEIHLDLSVKNIYLISKDNLNNRWTKNGTGKCILFPDRFINFGSYSYAFWNKFWFSVSVPKRTFLRVPRKIKKNYTINKIIRKRQIFLSSTYLPGPKYAKRARHLRLTPKR